MSKAPTTPKPDQIMYHLTRNYRAMQSVLSGPRVLKEYLDSWRETLSINLTLALYEHRLRMADDALGPLKEEAPHAKS